MSAPNFQAHKIARVLINKIAATHGYRGVDIAVEEAEELTNKFMDLFSSLLEDGPGWNNGSTTKEENAVADLFSKLQELHVAMRVERNKFEREVVAQRWFNNLC